LIGASNDLATVIITFVPNTQKMSYTKRPQRRMQPVTTLFKWRSSTPFMANAMPNKLLAIQCWKGTHN